MFVFVQLREASLLASKFFKDIAEIFDDQGLHAGGKCYHFPWEKFAEEKMAGEKNSSKNRFASF